MKIGAKIQEKLIYFDDYLYIECSFNYHFKLSKNLDCTFILANEQTAKIHTCVHTRLGHLLMNCCHFGLSRAGVRRYGGGWGIEGGFRSISRVVDVHWVGKAIHCHYETPIRHFWSKIWWRKINSIQRRLYQNTKCRLV